MPPRAGLARGTRTVTTPRESRHDPQPPRLAPSAARRAGTRLSARNQIQPFQQQPRDPYSCCALRVPQPVVNENRWCRRRAVNMRTIADEGQRNDDQIAGLADTRIEKLFAQGDPIPEERARHLEVIA